MIQLWKNGLVWMMVDWRFFHPTLDPIDRIPMVAYGANKEEAQAQMRRVYQDQLFLKFKN